MDIANGRDTATTVSLKYDPNYLALSRMLSRYQYLILLTPTLNETLDARLAPWQKKVQDELWSPLPFHRMKWLHSIEGARTILLKLEQTAQGIKVQRTKRDAVKDLAEKRVAIKRLRNRVEEIGREVESSTLNGHPSQENQDDDSETMYDVLQEIRRAKQQQKSDKEGVEGSSPDLDQSGVSISASKISDQNDETSRDALFESSIKLRRRQGKSVDEDDTTAGKSSGFSNLPETEKSLLAASKEHEDITTSLLSMAAQLKQQARQFQFTLDQDKSILDRALEGLDQNVSAMGLASKGMKTLQRMSEEQGFFGRLKLQLFIAGMWAVAILLVFAGPKLRF